jgi:hypothetical protein
MTTKTIEPGFFVMEDSNTVIAMTNLVTAKEFALSKVAAMPTARIKNIREVTSKIEKMRSTNDLGFYISSLVLKHTSEGLGVIR